MRSQAFPKPISPQAHRRFDQLAFPGLLALAWWMRRRNGRAAALIGSIAMAEGSAQITTDYPPPVGLPLMNFRDHNRVAVLHGTVFAALACALPGLSRPQRGFILGLCTVPFVLAALSDTGERSGTPD